MPPFRPHTGPDGRQANLDGDLCVCQCPVPPRLMARSRDVTMRFAAHEIVNMPGASGWMTYAGHTEPSSRYDEFFQVHDAATGRPVDGFAYGIKAHDDEHHDEHMPACDFGRLEHVTFPKQRLPPSDGQSGPE